MTQDMRAEALQSSTNGVQLHKATSPSQQKNGVTGSSVNGHSSPNGLTPSFTNGNSSATVGARSSAFYGHDREEVTRLLIQGLGDLGYVQSANRLCQESGYEVESPIVAAFRHAVLNGEWSEAESLLFKSDAIPDGGGVSIRNGTGHYSQRLEFTEGADRDYMKFILREQKYLEYLEKQDTGRALMVLQTELQPLKPAIWDRSRLNGLSEYVMESRALPREPPLTSYRLLVCKYPEDLISQARWDGSNGQSRQKLLQELSSKQHWPSNA